MNGKRGLPQILVLSLALGVSAKTLPYAGADGFGSHATGGKGGKLVHVTNLDDSGPGSLREGVSHGHRTISFDVGGCVQLKSILPIASDLTIDGATAPGDGIGTNGHEVSFSGSKNVICRYIRFRQGLAEKEAKKSAVGMHDAHDILLDHVSIQWGRWDTLDMTASTDVTIEYCIIGPGVAPQRFGCLCQSDNVTLSHNLWISNQSRNPKSKGRVQFINNVVYNWGKVGYVGGHSGADHVADLVGNYFIKGPSSSSDSFVGEFAATDHIYQSGNFVDLAPDGKLNGRPMIDADFRGATIVDKPWSPVLPNVEPADVAYQKVVDGAGCSLHRDAIDTRLIEDLKSLGTRGAVISDPKEMNGVTR
jgi:hypothetical protein